jgi:hypothetical protein
MGERLQLLLRQRKSYKWQNFAINMKINKDYLKGFCDKNNIFPINVSAKNKLDYYFGISLKDLNRIKNINQLEEVINNFAMFPSDADKQLIQEAEELYSNLVQVY